MDAPVFNRERAIGLAVQLLHYPKGYDPAQLLSGQRAQIEEMLPVLIAALDAVRREAWEAVEQMLVRKALLMPLNREAIAFNKLLKAEMAKCRARLSQEVEDE